MKKLFLTLLFVITATTRSWAGGDWNESGISWQPYADGLKAAAKDNKPVCLIIYTEWCPHCTNYSKLFHEPKVVDMAKKFVMIRVVGDKDKEVSKQYAPDGEYIPRTLFLSPKGELASDLTARPDKYKFFYNEADSADLLAGMNRALAKYK